MCVFLLICVCGICCSCILFVLVIQSWILLSPCLLFVYFSVSLSYFFLSISIPDPLSLHVCLSLSPSLRNWTVKFSWHDQQHFTKSIVTQPTQLLAHQKVVMAALTRSRMMQRQVSAPSITTTQAALEITQFTLVREGSST